MIIYSNESCTEYGMPGHPERPARVARTLEKIKQRPELAVQSPPHATETELLRAHAPEHLAKLAEARDDFDGDTPAYPGIYSHATLAAGGAMAAMRAALRREPAFSLMRPPGHHATRDRAMGFCYLGSVAVAALEAAANQQGPVAILDFDVHHGNGTEDIVLNHPDICFASIHQYPCYPGSGLRDVGDNCFNYPLAPQTDRNKWRAAIEAAIERLLLAKPKLIGVSAGFDAYSGDPLASGTLEAEDYNWIATRLRATGLPVFSVLEGGYSDALPELILSYLDGFKE